MIRDRCERHTAGDWSAPFALPCVGQTSQWAVLTAPASIAYSTRLAFLWAQIREVVLRGHCLERGESTQQRRRVWQRLQQLPGRVVVSTMLGLASRRLMCCQEASSRGGWQGLWRKAKHEQERQDDPRKQQPPDRSHGELRKAAQARAAGLAARRDARVREIAQAAQCGGDARALGVPHALRE